jgi:putative iron-regulated protein
MKKERPMNKTISALALAAVLALGAQSAPAAPQADRSVAPVLNHYAALVHANYEDTLQAAQAMKRAIDAFLAAPSEQTQQAARKAWRGAREFYGQTEAFRFYGGPIDDDAGPEGRLNAWPMDESYVDKVDGNDGAGLINDRDFAITKQSISEQNERGGEENIATGWHAIEFLLWGQDRSETGPGDRSFTDFVDGQAGSTQNNADRRRQYLAVVTELLIDDLNTLVTAWRPGSKLNYRSRFVEGGQESLRMMFVAMGSLSRGELAGERLEVALNSQDQEDEHSCFSDNTHRDAVLNATGIENVWLGRYRRADGSLLQGPSPRDLVMAKDATLADRTSRRIAASVAAARAIQAPFDREIVGAKDAPGRQRIQATVNSLVQQSKDLVAAANAVGISKLTLVQP